MNKAEIQDIQQQVRDIKTLTAQGETPLMVIMSKLASLDNKLSYHLLSRKVKQELLSGEKFKCEKYEEINGDLETR